MSNILENDGNVYKTLHATDFTVQGETKTIGDDLALCVQSAVKAEQFLANKQTALLWRDADLLYANPRPMEVFENTYVLSPNVQRFTVAKVCSAIVPQLYKGLFYADPPMILRPRPGNHQDVTDAKTALFSCLLEECKFKRETKWGLEQMGLLGTGIWKWGIENVEVTRLERKASTTKVTTGPDQAQDSNNIILNEPPKIIEHKRIVPRPFFLFREISHVLVDPTLAVSDIREAGYVVDVWYIDYYQYLDLVKNNSDENDKPLPNWNFLDNAKDIWNPPLNNNTPVILASDQQSHVHGVVHHAEEVNQSTSPDPLRKKLEILEYWDKGRKIIVLDRTKVLYSGKNDFNQIPFLSANWWNRPKAFYGMGLGLIVGQNQRVDQGVINAILKILSFGVNPIYLRRRDSNSPTQMIRTSLGKILTVDVQAGRPVTDAYGLLDMPKVPGEVFAALSESEKATESSSGADQMLVQGSTSGPRSSMGRTAGGASILAGASATRMDGPLDNFIEQVFKPFLYILDYLAFNYIPDSEIMEILGQELGKAYRVDMQDFHDARYEYEVLAGASLSAKRIMAQSLTLITQIFENPTIQQNLAEINGEYIDFKPILKMWMESSEWKNAADIIKPLTPEMKKRMQEKSEAAQQQTKAAIQQQSDDRKFQQKQQLNSQATDDRIKGELVRAAFRTTSMGEATEGEPTSAGLEGSEPTVE